jgi:hypothetical protein
MTSQAYQWGVKSRARSTDRLSLMSLATIVHNAARRIESACFYADMRICRYAPKGLLQMPLNSNNNENHSY